MHWWLVAPLVVAPIVLVALLRRLRRAAGLPLADAAPLGAAAKRTTVVWGLLVLAVCGLLSAGAVLVSRPVDRLGDLVPADKSTVVVLDVSSSVGDIVFQEIANTLRSIVDTLGSSGRVGLVLFSDAALEALPPGTRAVALEPYIRYFEPLQERGVRPRPKVYDAALPGGPPPIRYPINPWYGRFSGGTQISTGLAAARQALVRAAGGRGRVLLVSDLQEADEDLGRLGQELLAYALEPGIDLRVIALPPATAADIDAYRRVLGDRAAAVSASSLKRRDRSGDVLGVGFPAGLAVVVGLLALATAVYEVRGAPLSWRRTQKAEAL
jgi:hypothetical protein